MQKHGVMTAVLALLLAAPSCRRTPLAEGKDAGGDGDAPSAGDTRPADGPTGDAPADLTAEAIPDVAADVVPDASDAGATDASDAGPADAGDAGAAICPAGVAPLDVCGCGCCGEAMGRACYYPSRGETRESVPNPIPPPSSCAMAGCSFGIRHLCCADPGPRSGADIVCGIDTSVEDWAKFTITRRVGDVCTTLELGSSSPRLPIAGPPGYANTNAWRAPCDGSKPPTYAIGGLGTVTPGRSGTQSPLPRYDVHAVVFFDSGTGVAEAVRIDKDDVAVGPSCTGDGCPTCTGTCAFDAKYSYGYEAARPVAFAHEVLLAPTASFMHVRHPQLTMPADMGCGPAIPACGGDALDVADVMAAIADVDVQKGLEESGAAGVPRLYGVDPRSFDGQVFRFTRDFGGSAGPSGATVLVGAPCPPGSTPSTCGAIPPSLDWLVSVLTAFDQQQLADPSCAFVRP